MLKRPRHGRLSAALLLATATACTSISTTSTSAPSPPVTRPPAPSSTSTMGGGSPATTIPITTTTTLATPTTAHFETPTSEGPSYPARIRIRTTSDWTSLHLIAGGRWHDPVVVSAGDQVLSAGPKGDWLALSQTPESAGTGHQVDTTIDLSLTGLDPEVVLVFEIDRGHVGSTEIEITSLGDDAPRQVAVLTWDGIASGQSNTQTFEVSPEPFMGAAPNKYTVIAQINFWFYGPGRHGGFENSDGSRVTPLTPLLGETYAAADPSVVYQQIEWAVEYGVDAFSVEWTTPRGIGCCGSMEDTLDDVFLKSPNIHKVRWVIFYDFILRVGQTEGLGVDMTQPFDFDQAAVYDTFVSDFVHFAEKYFDHPQYLTIDGRPVIYIWATNSYTGNLAGAIQEARQRVSDIGFDVFIVGDEVTTDRYPFDPDHVALFDGSSTFTFLIPGIDLDSLTDMGDATVVVDDVFTWWRSQLDGMTVIGRDDEVNFQPAWAPQYDESYWILDNPIYVPATSRQQVTNIARVVRRHSQPVGTSGQRLIWLNTWNNWAETTTVEPTAALGPKYPAGNYQFDLLEVNRKIFGSETFFNSPMP